MVRGLPTNGALGREVNQAWTNDTELLAAIADRIGVMASQRAYSEVPPPIKRPWDDDTPQGVPGKQVSAPTDIRKFFKATTKRKGA